MRHTLLLSSILAALAIAGCGPAVAPRPENVVLIVVDTLRPDGLGCYGNESAETPAIDALAREGVRFEEAISPSPLALPAVCSILTGRTPPEHGVRYSEGVRLGAGVPTLAGRLSEAGFRTAAFVGSALLDPAFGLDRGFERYDAAFPEEFTVFSPALRSLQPAFAGTQRRAEDVTAAAADWLEVDPDRPFFLLLHYFDPHAPYDPPLSFIPEAASEGDEAPGAQVRAQYEAEVSYTDQEIGVLLDRLREAGLAERTLVVLTADHGEGLGERDEDTHGIFLYDSTLRVPLILGGAMGARRGGVVEGQVRLIDVAPTILDLLGVAPPEGISGTSLVPRVEGMEAGEAPGESGPAYIETLAPAYEQGWSALRGVRSGGWKYIRAPEPELYHVAEDPDETQNLVSEEPETAARMASILEGLEAPGAEADATPSGPEEAELLRRVRTLGYLGAGGAPDLTRSLENGPDPKTVFPAFRNERHAGEFVRLALLLVPGGQLTEARTFLEKATELQPDNPQAHLYLADVYRQQGLLAKARTEIDAAVRLDPDAGAAHYIRGLVTMQAGDSKAAEGAFRRALEIDPQNDQACNNLGMVYAQRKDFERAVQMFDRAIEINPDLPQAHANIGNVRFQQGDYAGACEAWEAALRLDPMNRNLHAMLGNAYSQEGEYERALAHYESFIVDNPDSFTVRRIRGAMETVRGKMAEGTPSPAP